MKTQEQIEAECEIARLKSKLIRLPIEAKFNKVREDIHQQIAALQRILNSPAK